MPDRLIYFNKDNDFTIVAYNKLYCDRQYERTLIQSVASIGSFFGLIIINYISDKKGKRTALIVSQIFGIFGVISKIFIIKLAY